MKFDYSDRRLYLCIGISEQVRDVVRAAIDGGVDVVQLREKNAEAQPIIETALALKEILTRNDIPFFINDRVDIAKIVASDGVHLGQGDISPTQARTILGPETAIGRSTHSVAECQRSLDEEIAYISAGPIEKTPTKPLRDPVGVDYAQYAIKTSPRPVFITGGITPEKIHELSPLGISHFVVVRYITQAKDAFLSAKKLRDAIDQYW
ncbi:thiamine phosphate synthase [Acidithrix ferrooxidans]|uniref:Thiamine-phosphate synthase n=1 Tax=Acidithrix ferrooxidans TaxID=1280514 RepID=A0A0D8HL54_9ACTN|nr:thiamine phosphate synthase [Acidithrix ferrooxidans]KJF17811.1 thiamine-phosphate synthase [Acidithrix ferrooxidans]